MEALNPNHIASALDLMQRISPEARLLQLKNLAVNNNGIWTIPDDPSAYSPVLYEVSVFGVPAVVTDPADLPRCWMQSARNILDGFSTEDAA